MNCDVGLSLENVGVKFPDVISLSLFATWWIVKSRGLDLWVDFRDRSDGAFPRGDLYFSSLRATLRNLVGSWAFRQNCEQRREVTRAICGATALYLDKERFIESSTADVSSWGKDVSY